MAERFRRKSYEIDALEWTGADVEGAAKFCGDDYSVILGNMNTLMITHVYDAFNGATVYIGDYILRDHGYIEVATSAQFHRDFEKVE